MRRNGDRPSNRYLNRTGEGEHHFRPFIVAASVGALYTSSTIRVRPSAAAARWRLSSCTWVLEGSSKRSSCERLVCIRLADALLLRPCSRRKWSICQARTSLTAAARTSSWIPSSFRKSSNEDPMWGLLIAASRSVLLLDRSGTDSLAAAAPRHAAETLQIPQICRWRNARDIPRPGLLQ
jgi:hypothetical protein